MSESGTPEAILSAEKVDRLRKDAAWYGVATAATDAVELCASHEALRAERDALRDALATLCGRHDEWVAALRGEMSGIAIRELGDRFDAAWDAARALLGETP